MILTTTPKRVPLLYKLIEESEQPTKRVVVTRGSTMDNAGNLSEAYMDAILGVYDGTKLARQELYGEMMSDVEGALWTLDLIAKNTVDRLPGGVPLRVIGVDPTVAERPGDMCGIVAVASTGERALYRRQAWVLEDASIQGAPEVWANEVVRMARKWGCPVVAEVNQGGALVRAAINQIDPTIPVYDVWSKQGKALRAEPITMAYEQGRVHHVGYMAELVDQMTSWIPGDRGKSPDRVDALVHALVALLVRPPKGFIGGNITARSYADRRIPKFIAKGGFRVR
jgi:phage terminase large subunit-like protein